MTPEAHIIGHDYSIYWDLITIDVVLCLCMVACSVWLVRRKRRSAPFVGLTWGGFFFLLLIGSAGLFISSHYQRQQWCNSFSGMIASYADIVSRLDHWKIQPGDPHVFSDWSAPFSLRSAPASPPALPETWNNPATLVSEHLPVHDKLAVPEGLIGDWQNLEPSGRWHALRRNQWAVAKITQDSKAFERCTKQIVACWEPVPYATTYRLQWRFDQGAGFHLAQPHSAHGMDGSKISHRLPYDGENTDWITVYTGARPFCVLTAPEGEWELRVRAENGTPEDDPHFNQLVEILNFPVEININVGYVYTMRFVDHERCQFIVSPISDANHNHLIDVHETPNDIGELFPATPLFLHTMKHAVRTMNFEVYEDDWGKWFSFAEPVWTPDKKKDGILVFDFRADIVHRGMFLERLYPLCLLVFASFLYMGAVLFVAHLKTRTETIVKLAGKLRHTISEVTEAKHVSEKALQAKTMFLTNMSHEFRTPLNAMLGFTEIFAIHASRCSGSEREACQEPIKQMKEYGHNLLELVDNILGVAAMDENQALRVAFTPVHLGSLILEVVEMMRSRAEYKKLTLTVDEPCEVPEWIKSDPAHVRQVLIHLIGNAIKFTPKGSISIRSGVSTEQEIVGMPTLYVSVSDTGIGIAPEHLGKIFEPFWQSDQTTTRRYGGTGIGLSVARQSAEMLNGHISVESQLMCGSTFTFVFPVQVARMMPDGSPMLSSVVLPVTRRPKPEIAEPAPAAAAASSHTELSGCRVLYVEDTKVNQILLSKQLEGAGAIVELAGNGQIGIDRIAEAARRGEPFDIILMDMQMPVLDGYEATRRLRAEGFTKPIIAITAHALPGDREKSLGAGCNEYVTKPVDFNRLFAMIARLWVR